MTQMLFLGSELTLPSVAYRLAMEINKKNKQASKKTMASCWFLDFKDSFHFAFNGDRHNQFQFRSSASSVVHGEQRHFVLNPRPQLQTSKITWPKRTHPFVPWPFLVGFVFSLSWTKKKRTSTKQQPLASSPLFNKWRTRVISRPVCRLRIQ